MISENFRVKAYIDLHRTSPFESEVIAYPSIFAISPGKTADVPVARLSAGPEECEAVGRSLRGRRAGSDGLSSMMRYLVKFHDSLDGGHPPVIYKNARFGNLSLSIFATACSNSGWK